jgi:protein-S-isoprenylcysteine O-methyltransferase Ste14
MSANTTNGRPNEKPDLTAAIFKRFAEISIGILVIAVCLFASSGRLDWGMAWVFVGLNVVGVSINALILLPHHQELVAERAEIKADSNIRDLILGSLAMLLSSVVAIIIAGLDERFGWSPPMALTAQLAAMIVWVLGFGLVSWAMASNPFFSCTVRIQEERGHVAVTGGPYRYVRHPGYVGIILYSLAPPVLLGSLWALIPAGLGVIAIVVRTALEDRMLQEELPGYAEYAQQTRYRLLPGVW